MFLWLIPYDFAETNAPQVNCWDEQTVFPGLIIGYCDQGSVIE